MIKGVIFDIDDTLYIERDYVKSGFWAVSCYISERIEINKNELFGFLWNNFESGVRKNAFDRLIKAYPRIGSRFEVEELINVYRTHEPKIELLPDVKKILILLRHNDFRLGIISDGYLKSQQAKIKSLHLESYVDTIQLTDYWGREFWKPNPRAYELCSRELGLMHSQLCYIADNCEKDFVVPNNLGWLSIKIELPGQQYLSNDSLKSSQKPHYTIVNYGQLLPLIETINSTLRGEI